MLMHIIKSYKNRDSSDNWMRQAPYDRVMRRCSIIVSVSVAIFLVFTCTAGYCSTMQDVEAAVAAATTGNCTGHMQANGQGGYDVMQTCLIPGNTLAVFSVILGNDCQDGFGSHFPGGPGQIGGCNGVMGSGVAYVCDNTVNTVAITSSMSGYRSCYVSSVTVLCDGTEISNPGGYIDLGLDCSFITQSPCPISVSNPEDSCYETKPVASFSGVCDDFCCGSPDPCCGTPDSQCCEQNNGGNGSGSSGSSGQQGS